MTGTALLHLRARMIGRALHSGARADRGALLALVVVACAAAYVVATWLTGSRDAAPVLAAQVIVLALLHGSRADARFLHLAGRRPAAVYAWEYALLSVPFWALLAASGTPQPAAGTAALAAPVLVAHLPPGAGRRLRVRPSRREMRIPVPAAAFEWIAGVRVFGAAVICVYAGALLLRAYPAATVVAIAALAWVASLFQVDREPHALLEALGRGPAALLHEKAARSAALLLAFEAPIVVAGLALHADARLVILGVLAAGVLVHVGSVFIKYASYRPGGRAPVALPLGVFVLGVSMALPPAAVYLLYAFRRAALRNLRGYLDDLG